MEYYRAMRMHELELHGKTRINFTNIILSKRNPAKKHTYYMIEFILSAKPSKTKDCTLHVHTIETEILKKIMRNITKSKMVMESDSTSIFQTY